MGQTDARRSAVNPACFNEQVGAMNYVAFGQLHEPGVRPILVPAYSHYKPKTISLVQCQYETQDLVQ